MSNVPFTNNKNHIVYVGPKAVHPGQTREVDESMIPKRKPATEAAPVELSEAEILAAILANSLTKFPGALVELSEEMLDKVEAAEKDSDKPRKGALEAIQVERLSRANATQERLTEVESFKASLLEMDLDELETQLHLVAEDEGMVALVNAEIDLRLNKTSD